MTERKQVVRDKMQDCLLLTFGQFFKAPHNFYPIVDQILDLTDPKGNKLLRIRDANKPKVICLCGSTRFTEQMLVKQWELTKQGYVVLSWCALPDWYFQGDDKAHVGDQEGVKEIVDEVHLRKIDLADEVFVLNIKRYIGESTAREIKYAQDTGKLVKYSEELTGSR